MIKTIVGLSAALIYSAAAAQGAEHSHQHHMSSAQTNSANPDSQWRAANDRVKEIGGWKAYAKETQADQAELKAAAGKTSDARMLSAQDALTIAFGLEPNLMQILATLPRGGDIDFLLTTQVQREALMRQAAIGAEVRKLYFEAIAAQERLAYQRQVTETLSIAAELSSRMRKIGNTSVLAQSEEQLMHTESLKSLALTETRAKSAREALIRRLNLSGPSAQFDLAASLPPLPATQRQLSNLEQRLLGDDDNRSSTDWPTMIKARSEARDAINEYRRAFASAKRYRDEILPLQKRISEENVLRYNGMLISVFDLLADARNQVNAAQGYMDAMLAFWIADSLLDVRMANLKDIAAIARRDAWTN